MHLFVLHQHYTPPHLEPEILEDQLSRFKLTKDMEALFVVIVTAEVEGKHKHKLRRLFKKYLKVS